MRGDGPYAGTAFGVHEGCSPQGRGWSLHALHRIRDAALLPHARDGPMLGSIRANRLLCSLLTRGWSQADGAGGRVVAPAPRIRGADPGLGGLNRRCRPPRRPRLHPQGRIRNGGLAGPATCSLLRSATGAAHAPSLGEQHVRARGACVIRSSTSASCRSPALRPPRKFYNSLPLWELEGLMVYGSTRVNSVGCAAAVGGRERQQSEVDVDGRGVRLAAWTRDASHGGTRTR